MKFKSEVQLEALNNATTDTDKFLVSDSSTVKYRTGSQLLSDLGVSGIYVPYTGATGDVDLGTHTLLARDLVINHSSGSGVAASITKGGSGEALTINKTSGSGNAMSVTGGLTSLVDLTLSSIPNATIDTDRFIVSDSGTIKYRTGAQVLSDIGGQSALTNPITGTGTTNYVSKFTGTTSLGNSQIFDNGISVKYQNKAYYNTIQPVGTSGTVKWTLQDSNGNNVTTSSTNKVYRVQLVTTGTGTNTGATWIASNVDAAGWAIKVVNANTVSGSNYPYMVVDADGLPKVTTMHPGNYNVSISVEEFDGSNNGTTTGVFGLDDSITAVGGNVGIGTTSPSQMLQVTGNGVINDLLIAKRNDVLTSNAYGTIFQTDGNLGGIRPAEGSHLVLQTRSNADRDVIFVTGTTPTERMTIKGLGDVGIGTTSPGYKLDVNGGIRTLTGYIRGANTSADINIDGSVGSRLRYANQSITFDSSNATIRTNNTARLFINNAGNVGIGTTSPSVKLHVAGSGETSIDIQDTGGQQYRMFSRNSDKVFGFYDVTVGRTFFRFTGNAVASSNKLSLLESGGNVGIGTTTPLGLLSVAPTNASDSLFVGAYTVTNQSGGYLAINTPINGGGSYSNFYFSSVSSVDGDSFGRSTIYINAEEGFSTTSEGIGINPYTTSVYSNQYTAALQAQNGSTISLEAYTTSNIFIGTYGGTGGNIRFLTRGLNAMYITENQYVGVGTTTPSSRFTSVTSASGPVSYPNLCAIFGDNTSTSTSYPNSVGVAGRVLTSDGKAIYGDALTGGGWGGYFQGNGYFSGVLNIGTETKGTPSFGGAPDLVVADAAGGILDLRSLNTNIVANSLFGRIQFTGKDDNVIGYTTAVIEAIASATAGSGNGGGGILKFMTAANGTANSPQPRMFLSQDGRLTIGSSNLNSYPLYVNGNVGGTSIYASNDIVAFSDVSVKENIRPIENVIERVQKSRGVIYDRNDCDSKNNIGFIAQELEAAFPELVITNEDGTKAVKYQNAVAVMFEAIKEQQKQIDELKELITKLIK